MIKREILDSAERAVRWLVWPELRIYGPGFTSAEVVSRHNHFLRSGWSRSGSGAYHHIRCAPEVDPGPVWREAYPDCPVGQDPWTDANIHVKEKLVGIIDSHAKWIRGEPGGERASLQRANLRGANLREANLRGANLREADLQRADLLNETNSYHGEREKKMKTEKSGRWSFENHAGIEHLLETYPEAVAFAVDGWYPVDLDSWQDDLPATCLFGSVPCETTGDILFFIDGAEDAEDVDGATWEPEDPQ